ncbi:TonB-dependent receptor domain-containing protein [Parasphingorhabdus sp.]|uniref:TonB-dependent receptor domain-containing protein n=1 Tax=Parasphingorhabdus sp. TaxID=2709688 RepID=UPI003001F50B
MKKYSNLKASVAPMVLGLAMVSTPAFAQDETTADENVIVVTGSLISNPNLERSSPVNVTSEDEIELKLSSSAEELIREVPGLVPSIGSNVNNGNGGASFLNLRGIGSNRNLTLLDGNRIVPTDLAGRFDLNNIPLSLVERVDVLTGGASTTYGADAISGVVNFITKQDFAGFEAELSEQLTEEGDGNIFRADVTIGANFDDGRGNVVLALGYQERDPVYQGARAFSNSSIGSFDGLVGGSTTTVPSAFSFSCAGLNPCPQNGVNFSGNKQVDPVAGAADLNNFGLFNFNPFNILQTPFERFNIYAAGRYEITDAIEVYSRGLFSKNFVSTIIAPSGSFGASQTINVNNPFLPTGLRNQFCANNDFDPATAGIQTLTQAQCDAAAAATGPSDPNYRTFTTNVRRRTTEVGPRLGDYTTQMFDYKVGFRGRLTDSIDWDVYGSYGESDRLLTQDNYVLNSRLAPAILADDATTCRPGSPAGCVPINLFGPEGSITPDMAAFVRGTSTTARRASLAQARATLNGDIGLVSPLGGVDPIGFAVGGEYRRYSATQAADALAQQPGELGGAGGAAPNIAGGYDVYEGFGELVVPLIQDKPFFEDLTLEAGIRYSKYTVDTAGSPGYNTTTWKVAGNWTPVAGLKFRGGFNRAVRAPNIGELFSPVSTGLTNLGVDPCAGAAPVGNAALTAVCIAQGAPSFTIGAITNPVAGQANATGGGNPNVGPETADTYTVGMVWQPEFVPGLVFSADYYNIKVKGAITTPTPGDAIAACFGNITAASATDPACTAIGRNPADGSLSGDPATTPGLFLALSNLGTIATDGIDVSVNYKTDLGFAELSLGLNGNWTNSSTFQAAPGSLDRECVGYYSPNCASIQPEFAFTQRTTLSFETVDISLLWKYIDGVQYEPQQFADDLAAALGDPDCPDPQGVDAGGCLVEPAFRSIKAAHYFDLTARWDVMDHLQLTFNVQNLFDKTPPVVGNDIGSTSFNSGNTYPSTYDSLGRRYGVSAKITF